MSEFGSIGEKELLKRLKAGDQSAFTVFYSTYSNRIYSKLLKLTQSEALADEILQDTFVILWNKRDTINLELSIKGWLYKVAENEVYQLYRKMARDKRLQEHIVSTFVEAYAHTEEEIYLKESKDLLDQAMDQLTPQRRQAFKLCKIDGYSYQQAADIMGISVSTVSNHLVHATHSVRDYILKSKGGVALLFMLLFFG